MKIRSKIIFFFVVPVIIVYTFFTSFNLYNRNESEQKNLKTAVTAIAEKYTAVLNGKLNEAVQIAKLTATLIENNPELSSKQINNFLLSNLKTNSSICRSSIYFIKNCQQKKSNLIYKSVYRTPKGLILEDTATLNNADLLFKEKYWSTPKKTKKGKWFGPYSNTKEKNNKLLASYSQPILKNGQFIGIAIVEIIPKAIQANIDTINKNDFSIAILNTKGKYLKESIKYSKKPYNNSSIKKVLSAASQKDTGILYLTNRSTNSQDIVLYLKLNSPDWILLVAYPKSKTVNIFTFLLIKHIIVLLSLILILLVFLFIITRKILSPIAKLNKTAANISKEDFDFNINCKCGNEINTLSTSLKELSKYMKVHNADLFENKTLFELIFGNAPFGVIICCLIRDDNGNVVDFKHLKANPATKTHIGIDVEKIEGKLASEMGGELDADKYYSHIYERVVTPNKPYRSEQYISEYDRTLDVISSHIKGDLFVLLFFDISEQKKQAIEQKKAKQLMKRQDMLLDLIFDHTLDCIVLLDKDFNFVRVSTSYAKLCHRDISKFPGQNIFDLYPSELKSEFDKTKINKNILEINCHPFIFPDHKEWGTTYWDLSLVPITEKNGEIELFLFTLKNVTTQTKAKFQIEHLAKFPEENINPVSRFSKNGLLLYTNTASKKLIFENINKNENNTLNMWAEKVKHVYSSGIKQTTEIDINNRTLLITLVPIIENEYVNLYGVDITDKKVQENLLLETNAHLNTLIESIPDLVWLKDKNGVYLSCNPRFESFFGAKKEEIVGKTDYDFVDKELADFFREKDKAAQALGKASVNEELITFANDGHKELIETIKTPIYDSKKKIIGILGISRDITERKNNTEAIKAEKALSNSIIQSIPGVFYLMEKHNTKFSRINSNVSKVTGYSEDELYEMPSLNLIENKELYLQCVSEVYKTGSGRFKNYILTKDKKKIPYVFNISKMMIDNRTYILGIGLDVSNAEKYEKQLEVSNIKLKEAHEHAIYMLALASEYNDPDTGKHIRRIVKMTTSLALELGVNEKEAKQIGNNSVLHDLGKLGISDKILLKPGPLTLNEFEKMKQHTIIGAEIIGKIEGFKQAREIALSHHEKWDGTGYPKGLKGNAIPLSARIVAVVDTFDALISVRPYKGAWSLDKAIRQINKEKGTHFDPEVVDAFSRLHNKGKLANYLNPNINMNDSK